MMWRNPGRERKNCFDDDLVEFVSMKLILSLFSREDSPASMNSKISTQMKDMQVTHAAFLGSLSQA